jgi:hypothetical protein
MVEFAAEVLRRVRIAIRGAELAHRRVRELCLANVELAYPGDTRAHGAGRVHGGEG